MSCVYCDPKSTMTIDSPFDPRVSPEPLVLEMLMPVRTMLMPSRSAAAMTSSSRTDPPAGSPP